MANTSSSVENVVVLSFFLFSFAFLTLLAVANHYAEKRSCRARARCCCLLIWPTRRRWILSHHWKTLLPYHSCEVCLRVLRSIEGWFKWSLIAGCCQSQFDSDYPLRLTGIVSEAEFRQSIEAINRAFSNGVVKVVCYILLPLFAVGGLILFLVGCVAAVKRYESVFLLSAIVGFCACVVVALLATATIAVIEVLEARRAKRAVAKESMKYLNRSPVVCRWRLTETVSQRREIFMVAGFRWLPLLFLAAHRPWFFRGSRRCRCVEFREPARETTHRLLTARWRRRKTTCSSAFQLLRDDFTR